VILDPLVGTWSGEGRGWYPTIADFAYREEVEFRVIPGKPVLAYRQRTFAADDGRPLHGETGYWRATAAGTIELLLAHANGFVEVADVVVDEDGRFRTTSRSLVGAPSAKPVVGIGRVITVQSDELRYQLDMEAVGLPMQGHLEATLRRSSAE
jgi:hypothetical protein